jgi:protein SCO1
MKKKIFKGISFIGFIVLMLVSQFSCQSNSKKACCASASAKEEECHKGEVNGVVDRENLPEMSLYQLDSEWQNQDGVKMALSDLNGKVQVVAMVYTGCNYACPRIIADLKRIEALVEKYSTSELGIVLVTMDPERDTPEQMNAFARKSNLNTQRWQLLTSTESNIRELAVLLNMKYKKELDGEISHSNIISVLNREGEVVMQMEGLGIEPDEIVEAIEKLMSPV